MKILVRSLFKTNRLTKKANGNNIFKVMQSKLNQNPGTKEFTLDMKDIVFVNQVVFLVIKTMMQAHLSGNFLLKLEHATPLTINAFNLVFGASKLH